MGRATAEARRAPWDLLLCCGEVQAQQQRQSPKREQPLLSGVTSALAAMLGHDGKDAAVQPEASLLRDAMNIYSQRQSASQELRKAATANDVPRLRRAIESAQKVRAREPE